MTLSAGQFEVTITPVVPSLSTTGGYRWTLVDSNGQAYSSPNVYADKDTAKAAAEAFAGQLLQVETYQYNPTGEPA
jgi:hypothetical protein